MKQSKTSAAAKGFCTFCMGTYDSSRIGAHVSRCSARRDDADCVNTAGREHPMAFLLMAEIVGWPEAWLCLEAHGDVLSRQLERFIRLVWFPEVHQPGHFSPSTRSLKKRIEEIRDRRKDPRLDDILQKKDRFRFTVTRGPSKAVVNLTVVGYSHTAVMDLSIDLAAFPSGTDMGRKPAHELCPGLWGDGSDGTGEGTSVPTEGWSCDSQEGMPTPSSMGCQTPRRMRNSTNTPDRWIGSRQRIARPAWIA